MDDEIFNKLLDKVVDDREVDDIRSNMSQGNKKVSPESFNENNSNMEFYDQKMKDYELKLKELESHLNLTIDENRELNKVKNENESLSNEIKKLNKKIDEMNNNNESKSVFEKRNEEFEELKGSLNEYRNKYSIIEMNYKKVFNDLNQNEIENG
jgi:septal ring factor EnvC (AmiA/AmiB activator)